jgi:hypothetical protein
LLPHFGPVKTLLVAFKGAGEEAFSGVLHKHDLTAVTIARGSVQVVAAPEGGLCVNIEIKLLEFLQLSWRESFPSFGFPSQFRGN